MPEQVAAPTTSEVHVAAIAKKCPKCGKVFKPSGLPGHLRFVHNIVGEEAAQLSDSAEADGVSKAKRIFQIIDELKEIRARKAEVTKLDNDDFWNTDKVVKELKAALNSEEDRLNDELLKLQGKPKSKSPW